MINNKQGGKEMMVEREYLSCTDTAKLVRAELKKHFPGFKFSVRSKGYSGGASINVRWTDGPNTDAVDAVINQFAGATFDGMTDMMSYKPGPVSYGSDFVFSHRKVSNAQEKIEEAKAMIEKTCEVVNGRFGIEYVDHLARGMVYAVDYMKGETLEDTLKRVVFRETA